MDSKFSKSTFDHSSVQTRGAIPIKLLLRAGATNRLRFVAHEPSGRDLYGKTFLWFAKDYPCPSKRRTQCESQTNSKDHARIRALREPARSQHLKTPSTTCQISVSSQRLCNLRPITGLEHRYHIHPSEKRLCVSGCCNGLVQSTGTVTSSIKQPRNSILLGSLRGGDCNLWEAGNFQYRSRSTIHIRRVRESSASQKHSVQHGWQRKSTRQCFRRKALEVCEI